MSQNKPLITNYLKDLTKICPMYKIQTHSDSISIITKSENILNVLLFFKNHFTNQFKVLTSIAGVDYPTNKHRFKIVYELLSVRFNNRIRIKVFTHELSPIDSSVSIFPAANWYECEVWDMFGVFFINHPNLVRLLTDYGFNGYPLRKDFPLSGFSESKYNEKKKKSYKSTS
jgi:NADH dehydrogenase (ubiquinone) Fe-S protein 3